MRKIPIQIDSLLRIILSIVFIALLAQVTIQLPIQQTTIPVTGQSMAVLLVGYLLPRYEGIIAVFFYILFGCLGLPFFADGNSGWVVIFGGSGGFIVGFLFGAAFLARAGHFQLGKKFLWALAVMGIGTAIILFFGILRLAWIYNLHKALQYGFFPFWQGALIKIVLGALIIYCWEQRQQLLPAIFSTPK